MNSQSLAFILFFLFHLSPSCIDRIDVKTAWQQRQYSKIIRISQKYPSLFSAGEMRYYLAHSFFSRNQFREAASVCAKAAFESQLQECYVLLRNLRKSSPLDYRFGLGKAHFELGDMKKAFRSFYTLLEENREDQESRAYLVRIFQYLQNHDQAWEQLQYLDTQPRDLKSYLEKIERRVAQLDKQFSGKRATFQEEWEAGIYLYVLVSNSPSKESIEFLRGLYSKRLNEEPGHFTTRVKLANLLFAQKKMTETREAVRQLESQPLSPALNLSLLSLKFRLGDQIALRGEEPELKNTHSGPNAHGQTHDSKTAYPKSKKETKRVSEVKKLNLKPLDLSELALATASDLSPIHRLESEVKSRLTKASSDYEKRYLVKEIDRAENELLKREGSSAALQAYLNSPKGQELKRAVQEQEAAFAPVDRENAKQFQGEYNRFQEAMGQSANLREKKKTYQRFLDRWWRLSQGDDVNLLTQGAMKAYADTSEGRKLAREVYQIGLELNLKPPHLEMSESYFQDRGF